VAIDADADAVGECVDCVIVPFLAAGGIIAPPLALCCFNSACFSVHFSMFAICSFWFLVGPANDPTDEMGADGGGADLHFLVFNLIEIFGLLLVWSFVGVLEESKGSGS
jgi:hypothetical protein